MESEMISVDADDFRKLVLDVKMLKEALLFRNVGEDYEGESSDWVRRELAEARQIPDSENISLEELERQIVSK